MAHWIVHIKDGNAILRCANPSCGKLLGSGITVNVGDIPKENLVFNGEIYVCPKCNAAWELVITGERKAELRCEECNEIAEGITLDSGYESVDCDICKILKKGKK
jgi:hypothetical protein